MNPTRNTSNSLLIKMTYQAASEVSNPGPQVIAEQQQALQQDQRSHRRSNFRFNFSSMIGNFLLNSGVQTIKSSSLNR